MGCWGGEIKLNKEILKKYLGYTDMHRDIYIYIYIYIYICIRLFCIHKYAFCVFLFYVIFIGV